MRLEKVFDVHRMMTILDPTDEEVSMIVRAAATIAAKPRKSGEYGDPPIPGPADFVDALMGYENTLYDDEGEPYEAPVWKNKEDRDKSILLLRCISKVNQHLHTWVQTIAHSLISCKCPRCGKETIDVVVGPSPVMVDGRLVGSDGEKSVLDMTISCDCEPFTILDIIELENKALT